MLYTIKTPAFDKLKHHYFGSLLTAIAFVVLVAVYFSAAYLFDIYLSPYMFTLVGLPSLVVGIYKERTDKKTGRGRYELLDIAATASIGILASLNIFLLIQIIKQ